MDAEERFDFKGVFDARRYRFLAELSDGQDESDMSGIDSVVVAIFEGIPDFRAGDTLRVNVRIREATKSAPRLLKGLSSTQRGVASTFTVRKISNGIGVERIFPLHSPVIESVSVVRAGRVRQSRIYYLRERFGRAARIKERRINN